MFQYTPLTFEDEDFKLDSIWPVEEPPSTFNCENCQRSFTDIYSLQIHMREHTFKCDLCPATFPSNSALSFHQMDHFNTHQTPINEISIPGPSRELLANTEIFEPVQTSVTVKYSVDSLLSSTSTPAQPDENIQPQMYTDIRATYSCTVCGETFPNAYDLENHILKHDNITLTCVICGFTCDNDNVLRDHCRIHTELRPYTCEVCSQTFISKEELVAHKGYLPGEEPYKCKICNAGFAGKILLVEHHNNTHRVERPYKCDQCLQTFLSEADIKQHLASHSKKKPVEHNDVSQIKPVSMPHLPETSVETKLHECPECKRKIMTTGNLRVHLQTKHKVVAKSDMCTICFDDFFNQKYLSHHRTTHVVFKCNVCSKTFETCEAFLHHIENDHKPVYPKYPICLNHFLNIEKRINLQAGDQKKPKRPRRHETIFMCRTCRVTFQRQTCLTYHIGFHDKPADPSLCEICGLTFDNDSYLTHHMILHGEKKPFGCKMCGNSFDDKASLKAHVRYRRILFKKF